MSRSTVTRRFTTPLVGALLAVALLGTTAASAAQGSSAPGVNSAAALENPSCDAQRRQIKFPTLNAPACVVAWKDGAANGGATAQGVTKDTIKVVVLYADVKQDSRSPASLYVNQATGGFSNQRDTIIDADAVYASAFETWGRKVEYTFVLGSGADETAQRADAVEVAAMKPFAVLDAAIQGGNQSTGGLIFETDLVAKGVPLVLGTGGAPPQTPFEVSRGVARNAAEFAGKSLVGKKAQYGGDDVKSSTRKFGILYQAGDNGFDIDFFKREFAKYKGTIVSEGAFDVPPGTAQADAQTLAAQQMPTILQKMKSDGVTTIIEVVDSRLGLAAAFSAATAAEYTPEWMIASGGPTGGGAFPADLDIIFRVMEDQTQPSHAFGLNWFVPYVAGNEDQGVKTFQWYWGADKGSRWSGAQAMVGQLYSRIHLAGPDLTKAKMAPGALKGITKAGGAYSDSVLTVSVAPLPEDGVAIRDAALAWWSPDTEATDQATQAKGKGAWVYLDNARRYVPGTWPKNKTGFFDESLATSVAEFAAPPATEPKVPTYPCSGCPSAGSAEPAPSNVA